MLLRDPAKLYMITAPLDRMRRMIAGDETRCREWCFHQDMKCTPYLTVQLETLAALSEPVPEGGPAGGGRAGMEGPPTVRGRIPRPGNGSKKPDPGIGLDWRRDRDSNPSYDHS